LFRIAFTLFQFTMEFQGDVCLTALQDGVVLTLFLIAYTCFTNLTLLNIIMSIIVDTIAGISSGMTAEEIANLKACEERVQMRELRQGFESTDINHDGDLGVTEMMKQEPLFLRELHEAGLAMLSARELLGMLDIRRTGHVSVEDFTETIMRVHKPLNAKHLVQMERRLVEMDIKMQDHMNELLQLLRQPVKPTHPEHMPLEPAHGSQHIGLKGCMDKMTVMLNQLVDLNNQARCCQQENMQNSQDVCPTNRIDQIGKTAEELVQHSIGVPLGATQAEAPTIHSCLPVSLSLRSG